MSRKLFQREEGLGHLIPRPRRGCFANDIRVHITLYWSFWVTEVFAFSEPTHSGLLGWKFDCFRPHDSDKRVGEPIVKHIEAIWLYSPGDVL